MSTRLASQRMVSGVGQGLSVYIASSQINVSLSCLGPQLFLGMYPEEHFIETPVKEAMARFRKKLDTIVSVIAERNKKKKLPYYYLSPDRIPNSVAI